MIGILQAYSKAEWSNPEEANQHRRGENMSKSHIWQVIAIQNVKMIPKTQQQKPNLKVGKGFE